MYIFACNESMISFGPNFVVIIIAYSPCYQVFSFLDHINLCRAAIVCRQWRAASAHEDFWRCLNFENRNISLEQCEFYFILLWFTAQHFYKVQKLKM